MRSTCASMPIRIIAIIGQSSFPKTLFPNAKTRLTTATVCYPSRITVRPVDENPTEALTGGTLLLL